MYFDELTNIKREFEKSKDICDLFKLLSVETWKRIEYAYLNAGVKVFETTLTQNLIFTLHSLSDQYKLNINIYEADNEKTNGNDFELIIRFPDEQIEYYAPVQAKLLYRNGKYKALNKKGQIDDLLDYGNSSGSSPLYLFYNCVTPPWKQDIGLIQPIEIYGCTMIGASRLKEVLSGDRTGKRVQTLGFYNLTPSDAFPWHELVCPHSSAALLETLSGRKVIECRTGGELDVAPKDRALNLGMYPLDTIQMQEQPGYWKKVGDLFVESVEGRSIKRSVDLLFDSMLNEPSGNDIVRKDNIPDNYSGRTEFKPRSRVVINK